MKISPKQYAEVLYQAVQDKKDSQVKSAIKSFVGILIENNDLKKANKIIEQFSNIWNKEKRIVEVEISSASELNKAVVSLLSSYVKKISGAEETIIKQKVDAKLLGGAIIKYGDKILDGSLRTRLEELRGAMVK